MTKSVSSSSFNTLSTKIREKWDAHFFKQNGNKPVYSLIEYGKNGLYNRIFTEKFDSHFHIEDNLIKPIDEFGKWDNIMFNPQQWQCGNDWGISCNDFN